LAAVVCNFNKIKINAREIQVESLLESGHVVSRFIQQVVDAVVVDLYVGDKHRVNKVITADGDARIFCHSSTILPLGQAPVGELQN